MWYVQYTTTSERDSQSIYDYIADILFEPSVAQKLTDRIMDKADSLGFMPLRHKLCDFEPWRSMGWRFVSVDNYLIFYLPDESKNTVSIMRIMYGGRDIESRLSEEA